LGGGVDAGLAAGSFTSVFIARVIVCGGGGTFGDGSTGIPGSAG
jgi:hypothetical protein